jgi:hypothetical protein
LPLATERDQETKRGKREQQMPSSLWKREEEKREHQNAAERRMQKKVPKQQDVSFSLTLHSS